MTTRITPGTETLTDYYRERSRWRHSGEERMRFRAAVRMAQVGESAAVLDIGARDGGLSAWLPDSTRYQGLDIAPEFASDRVMIRDVSLGLPFPDASFDFVFCIEVLEHVPNPFAALTEIRRVLRGDGILVLSVPNPYHVKELLWNLFRVADRQGHIYSWTRQAMTALAGMNGFRLERTGGTYLHPPIPMVPLLSRSIVYRFVRA
jgi:SAM-dependent methyltransferase